VSPVFLLFLSFFPRVETIGGRTLGDVRVVLECTTQAAEPFSRFQIRMSRRGRSVPSDLEPMIGYGGRILGLHRDARSGDTVVAIRVEQNDVDEIYAFSLHGGRLQESWYDTVRGDVAFRCIKGVPTVIHRQEKADAAWRGIDSRYAWVQRGEYIERRLTYRAKAGSFE